MFADRFLKNFMKIPMSTSLKFRVKLVDSPCFFPKCQNHHKTFALKQDLPLTTKAGGKPSEGASRRVGDSSTLGFERLVGS